MASIAESLGRPFEARAFMTVAVAADPDRADLRTELDQLQRSDRRQDAAADAPGQSLADALGPELAAGRKPRL